MKPFFMTAGVALALAFAPAVAVAQSAGDAGGAGISSGVRTGTTMNNAGQPSHSVDTDAGSDANARNCAGAGCTQPGEAGNLGASTNRGANPPGDFDPGVNARNCAGAGCSQPGAPSNAGASANTGMSGSSAELPSNSR